MPATACRLRIRRPAGESRVIYYPRSISPFSPALFPPSVLHLLSPLLQSERTCTVHPLTHTKMAPYAPAQVALLHSWDNGSYSPVLDADDRYPTIEPSEDQYNGSYLSNVLPPLGSATSLIRSSSHRHSWSCHSSDEHQQCCDSGAAADSPQFRQVYTDGDYVYSSEGYVSSQSTPSDPVSLPTSSRFGPVQLMLVAISHHLVLLLRRCPTVRYKLCGVPDGREGPVHHTALL
jgi:hypothetical protein